jgi:hypothetical protein
LNNGMIIHKGVKVSKGKFSLLVILLGIFLE